MVQVKGAGRLLHVTPHSGAFSDRLTRLTTLEKSNNTQEEQSIVACKTAAYLKENDSLAIMTMVHKLHPDVHRVIRVGVDGDCIPIV